jgi:serine/threonine-protein kinase
VARNLWLACKRGLTKPCVIKVLLPQYSRDPEYRRRFLREAELLAQLRYCRIVPIIDFGECEGWLYIVMEYIDGVDLGRFCRALAAQRQIMPVEVVAYIAGEVFEALRHAHNRAPGGRPLGIIHRDITPGNVLISSEGEVFLTDFGLARRNMDLSGEVFGTLEYMAPEQAEGMATFQSDLYAERSPHPVRVPQQA